MDNHFLVEMAHIFHRIYSTIVDGKRLLIESLRKFCPFNLAHKGQFGNLIQRLAHNVISQAFVRWALIPTFAMVLLIVGEILVG